MQNTPLNDPSLHDLNRWDRPDHIKLLALELARKPGERDLQDLSFCLGGPHGYAEWSVDKVKSAARQLHREGIAVFEPGSEVVRLVTGHPLRDVFNRQGEDELSRQSILFNAAVDLGLSLEDALAALEAAAPSAEPEAPAEKAAKKKSKKAAK